MKSGERAAYWESAGTEGAVKCGLCPHGCVVAEGGRGHCGVRVNEGREMRSLAWGRPAAVAVDPVEKKPLYHFLPGGEVLSLGTLGCNLSCRFCQNGSLSRPSAADLAALSSAEALEPGDVARLARGRGVPMVAYTYNEPTVWTEWAVESAAACRAAGVRTVAVTNGYIAGQARRDFFAAMDAANVDLKSFSDDFYRTRCGARLAPVLETLEWIRRGTSCWLEVTTLLIPGLNDTDPELDALTLWVAGHLGEDTPLHFSAFHGACEMADAAPTPPGTLLRARRIARGNGLRHVYLGNVRLPGCGDTHCASCGALLVERGGYSARTRWKEPGKCPSCGATCPGVWS